MMEFKLLYGVRISRIDRQPQGTGEDKMMEQDKQKKERHVEQEVLNGLVAKLRSYCDEEDIVEVLFRSILENKCTSKCCYRKELGWCEHAGREHECTGIHADFILAIDEMETDRETDKDKS